MKAFSAQKTEFYWVWSQRPLCCPKMIFRAGSRLLIEWLITKVGPDALLLGAFRGGAVG